jgi:vanillin dehydrogenase
VLLHTTAGLGNAVGALATARVNRAPLVVLVGQQDRRHLVLEPFLAGRLEGLAGDYPVRVEQPPRPQDVPGAIARAWHEAATARGPALVVVPMDDWLASAPAPHELAAPKQLLRPPAVDQGAVEEVANLLDEASAPALVVGAGADDAATWSALVALAERLGSPVWQEAFGARAGFPQDHRLFAGHLPAGRVELRETLAGHDCILVVGAPVFRQYPYEPGPLVLEGTQIALVTDDPTESHRSPADLAVLGTPAAVCAALAARARPRAGAEPPPRHPPPPPAPPPGGEPLRAGHVLAALAERLPVDAVLIEEAPSNRPELHARLPARRPLGFLSAAMGGLGFALPAAVGLRMALRKRPVVAVVGDGSSLYAVQALWSAARYEAGALFVVLANGGYAIMDQLAEREGGAPPWPSFGNIDLSATARSLGCPAVRVERHEDLLRTFDEVLPGLARRAEPLVVEAVLAPEEQRRRVSMATAQLEQQRLLIGGEWKDASSGRSFERTDPFTGEPAGTAAAAKREDARAAADAAGQAFAEWSTSPPSQRRELLQKAAALLMERAQDIAGVMTQETGGTFGWGMFNCSLAAGMLNEAAAQTTAMKGEVIPSDVPGLLAMGVRQPAGVVVGIAPWNAPVILGTRAVASPLAYGNTVVLKASEICPRTHAEIARTLHDAGLPAGVINVLTHEADDAPDVVDELIAHPAVRRINFTGSTAAGRLIAENAARHLKRVLLELGGKAPMVVLRDADIEEAVAAAKFGAFMHQGQICMSTEKIVVDRSVADDFSGKLTEKARALKVGDPREPDTQIGPMINPSAVERVRGLVEDAVAHGAEVLAGGEPNGPLFPPTVIKGVTSEMRVYSEESFGPVVGIIDVDGPEEAVRVANDTEYGLAAAVFGRHVPSALDVARQIESGICHVNGSTVHDEAQMPFGGVKASGWGRFGGSAALEEFTELRWITVQQGSRQYPL